MNNRKAARVEPLGGFFVMKYRVSGIEYQVQSTDILASNLLTMLRDTRSA